MYIKTKNIFIILCLVILVVTNVVAQEDANSVVGHIRQCTQQESYANNIVRQYEYWQFYAHDGSFSDTYGLESYLGTQITSRILVDYQRNAVFYMRGDTQYFYFIEDMTVETPCLIYLYDEFQFTESINPLASIISSSEVYGTDVEINQVNFPIQLLLAPAFIGEFPTLAAVPLAPYDGRGFSQSISFDRLPAAFAPQDGRLSLDLLDQLAMFYVDHLLGWDIAPIELTNFPNNPELLPGDRQAYLTLFNTETEATIDLFFNVPRNQEQLDVVISVPQSAVETHSESVIEGSSQSLATLNSFFSGWDNPQPSGTYLDGRVEAYALQQGNEYWFVDLEIENGTFEVLFSEVVVQSEFVVEEFLPEWARSP